MLTMTTVEARKNFSEMINQVAYGNECVVLTRRDKALVAVISLQQLKTLEKRKITLEA